MRVSIKELWLDCHFSETEGSPPDYAFGLLEVGCSGTIEVIPDLINKTCDDKLKPLTTVSGPVKTRMLL